MIEGLKSKKELSEVFESGKRVRLSFATLIYFSRPIKEGKSIKLLIMVKKKLGKSVVRNRVRRLIKEAVRLNKEIFPEKKEHILVFLVRSTEVNFHQLSNELKNKLKFLESG